MNAMWMRSVALVAAMVGFSALAAAGTPPRPRASGGVNALHLRTGAGVWDDTDIAHVARPNTFRAQLASLRDGTSNTLRAQPRPARLADDSVGAGLVSPRGLAPKALPVGVTDGTSNTLAPRPVGLYDSPGNDTLR
jgi:hypothetical protein